MSVMLELVTNLQEKMRDDPDIFPVLPSSKVRASPGARLRKTGKGCNPVKLQGCTAPILSSAVRKGNGKYGRSSRKPMSESVLIATNSERRVVVGGKIATKRIVDSSFPKKLNENIVKESQVALLEPNVTNVGEIKCPDEGSFSTLSAHCVDRHVNRSPRQHSYSEKVSKWLEDSDHSTVTELLEYRNIGNGDLLNDPEQNDDDVNDVLNSLAIALIPGTELVGDGNHYEDSKLIAESHPKDDPKTQAPVKIFTEAKVWRVTKIVVRYLKIVTCVSIVFLGVLSHIRLETWDYYEPPPT